MSQRASGCARRPPLSQALIDERRLGMRGSPATGAPKRLDEIANEILDRLRVNGERRP